MAIVNNPHEPIRDRLYSDELKDFINRLLTKDPEQWPSIQELVKVQIIQNAIHTLPTEYGGKLFFELRKSMIYKDIAVKKDKASLLVNVPLAISKFIELPSGISMIDFPESIDPVWFVYLWGDRLYTETNYTLYVYSLTNLSSPSASYTLGYNENVYSALITNNRLYVGGTKKLHIFEVTSSPTEPLIPITKIPT